MCIKFLDKRYIGWLARLVVRKLIQSFISHFYSVLIYYLFKGNAKYKNTN